MKEVEGTITAEEALRYTYKLIFKQDLKEIREWGLFTDREDTISKFFGPSAPLSVFTGHIFRVQRKSFLQLAFRAN